MDIELTRAVFTPTSPARVAFIERSAINDKLVNALSTPGKQIVVYGHSGSGKTTLLVNKLKQTYEFHITTRCMKGMKFEQIVLDAFDQLSPFYQSERTSGTKSTITKDISSSYLAIQAKISASDIAEQASKEIRLLPPQLTAQALGRFMGAANACWLIEDFHKIEDSEKPKLSQLMKIFMDLADEFMDLKIIALGAVDTARQVIDYDPEMRNRVAEVHVSLMSEEEISEIIAKGEAALNVVIGTDIKNLISKYSNGLASVCHHLCLNMCIAEGLNETSPEQLVFNKNSFEKALKVYVEEASDSIRSSFDKALKQRRASAYNNQDLILRALMSFKERGASRRELHQKILEKNHKYPEANLKTCLPKLSKQEYGEIVRYDLNSGLYSFSDPIYRAFALVHFRESGNEDQPKSDLNDLMRQLTAELRKQFPQDSVRVSLQAVRKGKV